MSCKKCVGDLYPLHKACSAGHILCVQQFINNGMSISQEHHKVEEEDEEGEKK